MSKYYIAYGSNLNVRQMAKRCPSAKIVGSGMIQNWKLKFHTISGPAYATIIKSKGDSVPVLIWEIDTASERALDRYEGYPRFYVKKIINIKMDSGLVLKGMAYIMNNKSKPGTPTLDYLRTIYEGYYVNKLDIQYFDEAIEPFIE